MKLDQNSFMEDNHAEKFSPWTTYSDIFCSLMMVFVLLFSYAMIQYSLSNIKKEAETELILQTNESQEQTIKDLQALQSEYESELILIRTQLAEAEKKANTQPQVVSLQSELSNTQYELQIIMAEKRALSDSLDSVSNELADLIIVAEEQTQTIDDQKQQLIILNAENKNLQEQIDALTSKNADLEAQILLLDADLTKMSAESGDKDGSIEEQKVQLIALSDKNEELEAQLVLLSDQNTELNSQIAILSDQNTELNSQLVILSDDNVELNNQLVLLSDQNAELNALISAAENEVAGLSAELDLQKAEVERLQNMIIVLQGNSDSMNAQIVELANENDALATENSDLRARLAAIMSGEPVEERTTEEAVAGIRLEIIAELSKSLEESGVEVSVDGESGAIMLNSEVLFAKNESALKSEGKAFLDRFFPTYFDVLAKGGSAEYIAQITVEGHADPTGDYYTNLDLSMRRAQSVLTYCASLLNAEDQEILIRMFNASGCAYAKPIYENGVINMEKSRRVEMKFTLKDASMIEEIRRIVEEKN